jgi:hypothetical protein
LRIADVLAVLPHCEHSFKLSDGRVAVECANALDRAESACVVVSYQLARHLLALDRAIGVRIGGAISAPHAYAALGPASHVFEALELDHEPLEWVNEA